MTTATEPKKSTRARKQVAPPVDPQPAPGADGAWAGAPNGETPPVKKPPVKRKPRASGKTAGEESAEAAVDALANPVEPELPEERARKFRTPGFHRMRTEWAQEEGYVWARITKAANERVLEQFSEAYQIMVDIFLIVRQPVLDDEGRPKIDADGLPSWKRSATGAFVEDYSLLAHKQKEDYLFQITTNLFAWEQKAADIWGEAMFAKAIFEERFAIDHTAPMTGTISDREAEGTKGAAEEKYFAVFLSYTSRKADALVRIMSLLGQRIRDSLAS